MRYLPLTDADRQSMLAKIGVNSIDDLFQAIPDEGKLGRQLNLPEHRSESEVENILAGLSNKNISARSVPSFVGCGAYHHHVPATVDHLIQRSEFLTTYTPYQPEIAQGTLQYLFEFQTQVALLTGMEVANASMYDGSTACGEAVLMASRVTKRRKALLSGGLHPHYREVVETLSHFAGHEVVGMPPDFSGEEDLLGHINKDISCVVVQIPSFFGNLKNFSDLAERVHEAGALLVVVVTEVVSLGAIRPPGEMGADIVVGEGQSIGNGLNFGGPYVGLFATREKFLRQMPGRVCGKTVDADGRSSYVLTLSTREQHIRREKATSNICTNSGLCCLAFSIHLTLLGEAGLKKLAELNHANAVVLAEALSAIDGVDVLTPHFFNEFTIRVPRNAEKVIEDLLHSGILGGVPVSRLIPGNPALDELIIVAATELTGEEQRAAYVEKLRKVLSR